MPAATGKQLWRAIGQQFERRLIHRDATWWCRDGSIDNDARDDCRSNTTERYVAIVKLTLIIIIDLFFGERRRN